MPKRGENIYKRKDGRWEGRYIKCRDNNNKAKYGYIYGKSYTDVKLKMHKIIHLSEMPIIQHKLDWDNIILDWLESKKLSVKPSTLARYYSLIKNHISKLAQNNFDSQFVFSYLDNLLKNGYSPKTTSDILTVVKNILHFANNSGQIENKLIQLTIKIPKKQTAVMSESDEKKLCHYLCKNINNRNLGILICICTGIRIGELCALKWSDINFDNHTISINRTMLRIQDHFENTNNKTKVIISSPKSEDSVRLIPISTELFEKLIPLKRTDSAFVLSGLKNKYIEPRNIQYHFKSVLKQCGIKTYSFHTLRHTFATRCIENGVELKSLSEMLGHSSIKITLDKYVHSSMKLKRMEIEKTTFISC